MFKALHKGLAGVGRGLMSAYVYLAFRPDIKYVNKELKHMKEPVIFVGNHTSHMDGVMTSVIFSGYHANILVAKDWYEKPKFNWFLKNNRCIPMDRYGVDTGWLRYSREAIKKNESVILYPEGKTRKEFEPDTFKSGFIMLAIMTGAKIVPYAVDGEYKKFFGKRQRVLIGDACELTAEGKGLKPEYLEKESERFRQMVIDLRKQIRHK